MRHPRRDAEGTLLATSGLCVHKTVNAGTSGSEDEEDIWAGSRQLAMDYGNSTYFFNADQVGTERVATDSTGAVAQTCTNMRRDAFQQPRRPASSGSGPYGDDFSCTGSLPQGRFAGYDTNDEYGLAHAPARYYLKASRVRVLHLPA